MINNFEDWWNEIGSQAPLAVHDNEEHTKRIAELAWNVRKPIDWQNDAFVVVVETDCGTDNKLKGNGPMVWETYTGRMNLSGTIEHAKALENKYGWNLICRLEIIGNADECAKILDSPF